jgi:hypothetical protein
VVSTVVNRPGAGVSVSRIPYAMPSARKTHSAVASSTSAKLRQGPPVLISSVLYKPIVDSISALSSASPTVPTEASMPAVNSENRRQALIGAKHQTPNSAVKP